MLDDTALPEGFERVEDGDVAATLEVLSGTVPADGTTLTLKVYYKRLTFTVKFDGFSEETYKYGYELTLDDIPEDDEVDVTDDKKFIGWSTDEEADAGTSREDLAGLVITADATYYPVIVDKDNVLYIVEHYFEALELNDDGTPNYVLDEELVEEHYGKIGTSVKAEKLEIEGFEYISVVGENLSGQIPKEEDGTLVLKVFYGRKLINVYFYDATDDYYDSETESYSQYSKAITVRYGTTAADEANVSQYPTRRRGGDSINGFYRSNSLASVYGEKEYHVIPLFWWYEDEATGEFAKLYDAQSEEEPYVFTEDLDVYSKAKILEIRIGVPDSRFEGYYYVYYDDSTRLMDTAKDAIFTNAGTVTFDIDYVGIEDKAYEKIADRGLLVDVDGNYEIINVNKLVRFARLMGEENFKEFLESFYDEEASETIEEFLFNFIMTHETQPTAEHLKELIDDLVGEHKDIAESMIADIAVDIIEYDISFVEEFFEGYVDGLVEAEDTEHLVEMLEDMFADYKAQNEDAFVAFVSDTVIDAISDDEPNATVLGMIEDYIKSEIKNGTFDDEIINYIMGMEDDDFIDAVTSVVKNDFALIEADVKNKILTDDSFVETMIGKIFDFESETVDNKIKSYIKDYNLADDYIENHPEVIVDYLDDEELAQLDPAYVPGVLTRDEKIEVIKEYIETESDAVEKLKSYAGTDLDTIIDDYYDNNKDTVESEMIAEVLTNGELRISLADFAITLLKDDEFSSLLDFSISDHLTEVVTDDDEKLKLAEKVVEKLGEADIFELDFVQDAVDTVIDDVIADITSLEKDGDDTTESVYVANIEEYAESLTDFSDIIEAVLYADKDFRNSVVDGLFANLYLIDEDHTIILEAMQKVTDKMIEEEDVDVNILVTIVDYIKYAEHGEDLAWDIVDNLLEIDDILSYAEEHLGWVDESGGQLAATLKFRDEATYDEEFEVTPDNLFIMDMVRDKVVGMTFDGFMDEYIISRLPDRVPESYIDKLPIEIVENIYNRAHDEFIDELDAAILKAETTGESSWVSSGFMVRANPVDDVVTPLYDWLLDGYDKANAKAEAYGGRVSELYLNYYRDNPYIADIVDLSDPDLYIDGTSKPVPNETSGYYVTSFENIYYDVIMPGSVLGDDLMVWYMNKVPFSKLRGFAEDNEALILAMYNHPNVLLQRYAEEGLPEDMSEYYYDLMEDPEIKKAFDKIDNKVSFEMEPFVLRFLTNSTAEMYYYKGLERMGMKADEILDKYAGSDVKKELTSENFEAMLDELEYCWEDGNKNATTDYVLGGGLHELLEIYSVDKSFRGYTFTFERTFADR